MSKTVVKLASMMARYGMDVAGGHTVNVEGYEFLYVKIEVSDMI